MRKMQIILKENIEETRRFFYDYLKELSQFDSTIEFDSDGTPIYNWFDNYWEEKERYPFLLCVENKFAGLALIREVGIKKYEIAEFYVIEEYRKDGNALWFASQIVKMFDGTFLFSTRIENKRAIRFWDKFVVQFDYNKSEIKDSYKNWVIKTNNKTEF